MTDPKDWFSDCENCGTKYETRFLDNGLCIDCSNKELQEVTNEQT